MTQSSTKTPTSTFHPLHLLPLSQHPPSIPSSPTMDSSSNPANEAGNSTNTPTQSQKLPNRPKPDTTPLAANSSSQQPTNAKMNGTPQPAASTPTVTPTTTAAPATPAATPAAAQDKPNAPSESTQKLSGAELKKRAKAEKAARRAKEKLERDQAAAGGGGSGNGKPQANQTPSKKGVPGSQSQKNAETAAKGQKQLGGGGGAAAAAAAAATAARRGSIAHPPTAVEASRKRKKDEEMLAAGNTVAVFSHLSLQKRRGTIAGAGKELHPAILALGLQLRDYVVCGSSARCVAMLLAFKRGAPGGGGFGCWR
ncbi:hypothetical protein AJ79_07412 [Helicocarpus griseus UAMH5409]|uniref:Uncharacterized protein n=1 Tax=Helicocarpus griseus UAMH5409 TaxID=1447875 RepID=A0A2B7X377_9EURO|nr:hypothetical protein AJ79_07412 [Helicocarpus griseus UAMH5409]